MPAPTARFVRLTVDAEQRLTWLSEVWAWGDAVVSDEFPERIVPYAPLPECPPDTLESIPGLVATRFARARFEEWRRSLGTAASARAVWAAQPLPDTWLTLESPLLPAATAVAPSVELSMARNETEVAMLSLTNTSADTAVTLTPRLSPWQDSRGRTATGITAVLHVGAAIRHERQDVPRVRAFLPAGNMPAAALLQERLTNGAAICKFPLLTLPPAGSALLWVRVTTGTAAPGVYTAVLEADNCRAVPVTVRILDVSLPLPRIWMNCWASPSRQLPCEPGARREHEIEYIMALGQTSFAGFPEPDTTAAAVREVAARQGLRPYYHLKIPYRLMNAGYQGQLKPEDVTEADRAELAEAVHGWQRTAAALNLEHEDWYVELWDEPGPGNADIYGALAACIKAVAPGIQIYCNPCFWIGQGFPPDAEILAALEPFYNRYIDVSVPIQNLVGHELLRRELWDQPRPVRAFYIHPAQRGGRGMAWRAFRHGWNGWAFYAYASAQGHPWSDVSGYSVVCPGPLGPVPTTMSESMREAWEDYRLLTVLREQGRDAELVVLLDAQETGAAFAELRDRALAAAAGRGDN